MSTSARPTLTDFELAERLLLAGLVFTDAAAASVGHEALARLRAAMVERASAGAFFASMPVFVVSGTR